MVTSEHGIQRIEVVVGVLLLLMLSFDVFVPTSACPLLFLNKREQARSSIRRKSAPVY